MSKPRHLAALALALALLATSGCSEDGFEATCRAKGDRVDIAWTPLPDFASYRVYRVENGAFAPIGMTANTSFVDASLTLDALQVYVVKPLLPDGSDAPELEAVCGAEPPSRAAADGPLDVGGLVCRGKDGKVDLSWSSGTDAVRWRVLRAAGEGTLALLAESDEPVWADLTVANGTAYRYAVVALDAEGAASEPSPTCDATPKGRDAGDPGAPGAVGALTCRAKDGKANLRWNAVAGAARYRVERTTGAGPFLAIGESASPAYADFQLYTGNTYDYRVVALGADGSAAAPSAACRLTPGVRGGVVENRAPTIISTPPFAAKRGANYLYDAEASDPDPGDVLGFALITGPPGLTVDSGTGVVRWTPAALGAFAVVLEVTDGRGGSDRQAFTIGVSEANVANQRPLAVAGEDRVVDLPAGAETVSVALDGSASSDADGFLVSHAWSGAIDPQDVAKPTVVLPPGEHAFVLHVVDNAGGVSEPANVVVQVRRPVTAPTLRVTPASASVLAGQTLVLDVEGSDPGGGVVTLAAGPALENATFATDTGPLAQGVYRFTPVHAQAGRWAVRFQSRNASGLATTQTVEIEVIAPNRPPVLSVPATAEVEAGRELVLAVTASDPDLDPVEVAASGVPANALFLPGARTLTFQPTAAQIGTHGVTFTASDGAASAAPVTVSIQVKASAGETPLVLEVDPPASPSFAPSVRVTGRVNVEGGESPIARTPLVTGVSPANGVQGATVDVALTGETSGPRAPNFQAGVSAATFGEGVTVESLTVESASRAVARVRIAPTAALGPRQIRVTTGDETAESVLAFDVALGRARIEGRLVDETTGQPIAGAIVAVEGSPARVTTRLDGTFSLDDLPGGATHLVVLAPNHAPVRREITALAGQTLSLENVGTAATVFDPTAPASATLLSVLGRGATSADPRMGRDALKAMVTDALLTVGGNESGVLDEHGNQVSTVVQGEGFVSATDFAVGFLADRFQRGESFALVELLLPISESFQWTGGARFTVTQWLAALQQEVDRAWADPAAPDSKYAIVLFNRGPRLLPEAPRLSATTRLNPLQSYLFVSSFLTYVFTGQSGEFNSPSRFWRGMYRTRAEQITDQVTLLEWQGVEFFGTTLAGVGVGVLGASGTGRILGGLSVFSKVARAGIGFGVSGSILMNQWMATGVMLDRLNQVIQLTGRDAMMPEPPRLHAAELVVGPRGEEQVRVRFDRSGSERPGMGGLFYYTLYRFDPGSNDRVVIASRPSTALDPMPELVDPAPPRGSWFYSLTATRLRSLEDVLPPAAIEQLRPLWSDPLLGGADPANLLQDKQSATSDYSVAGSVIVGPPHLLVEIPEIEVSPDGRRVYRNRPNDHEIWSYALDGDVVGSQLLFANSGFATPGHRGLAVDRNGVVYTDNAASDASYGGRLFSFVPPSAARDFVGTIQYFSRDLQFARPVLGGTMTIAPGAEVPSLSPEDLYVFEQLQNKVFRVPVQATGWDPYRRNGKPHADVPAGLVGRALDLEPGANGDLHLLYAAFGERPARTSLTLGPSIYEDGPLIVPPGAKSFARPPTPTSELGVASVLGRTRVRLNANVFDGVGNPLSGRTVRFRASHGVLESAQAVTDSNGVATVTLAVELGAEEQGLEGIDVQADVEEIEEPLRATLPVIDGVAEIQRRYPLEQEVGLVIRDGTYFRSYMRLLPIVGGKPGRLNNFMKTVTGEAKYSNFACGNWQSNGLTWMTRLVQSEPWIGNGLEYGGLQSLWGGHQVWAFWKDGESFTQGWVGDGWPQQRPEIFTFAEWASHNPGWGPSQENTNYPVSGSQYYPSEKDAGPVRTIDFRFVGAATGDADVRLESPSGGVFDAQAGVSTLDAANDVHGDPLTFSSAEPRLDATITGTRDGQFTLFAGFADTRATYENVPIRAGETARVHIDANQPGAPLVFQDGRQVAATLRPLVVLSSLEPASAAPGTTLDVRVRGDAAGFSAATQFDFGGEIEVTGVRVVSASEAVVTIQVGEDANGERPVIAETDGRTAISEPVFEVTP